jgi:hypothetical protein
MDMWDRTLGRRRENQDSETRIVGSLLAACVEKLSDSSVKRERKRQSQPID